MSFYIVCPCGCKKQLIISDEDFNITQHEDGTYTVQELMECSCGHAFWFKRGKVVNY